MEKCYHETDSICSISEGKRKCADLDKSPFCAKNIQIMTTIDYFRCKNCNNLFKESDLITTIDGKELCKTCWIDNYKCQTCEKDLKEKDTVTTIDNKIICHECWIGEDKTDDKTGIEITIDNLKCCMNCRHKMYDEKNRVDNERCQEWAGKEELTEYCGGWKFDGLSVDKRNIYR